MARISTYPLDTNLVGTDYWIGSDANSAYATKNFTIDSVAAYMNREGAARQALNYVYTQTVPVGAGTISFRNVSTGELTPVGNINFDQIGNGVSGKPVSIALSKSQLSEIGVDISPFYTNPLASADVLITQGDDVNNFGIFTWGSSTQLPAPHDDFYNIPLTFVQGGGTLTLEKEYFISLLTPAGSSGDATKKVTLNGASTYTITHGLNKYPSVSVASLVTGTTTYKEVYADVTYDDINTVTIDFATTFNNGEAYFN
mgnify:CR=1 FL=1|jgi:hypothetical protein|tara:strand:- start:2132 stop:2902 length:771 start_codon:yes stop_codon:yes gene_type:complete